MKNEMTYTLKEEGKVNLYSVTDINTDTLMQFRKVIIDRYSKITSVSFEELPEESEEIRNVRKTPYRTGKELFYRIEADQYDFPRVVKLIDEILKGHSFALGELMTLNPDTEPLIPWEVLQELTELTDTMKSNKPFDFVSVKDRFLNIQRSLDSASAATELLYDAIKGCISSELVKTVSVDNPEDTGIHM